MSNPDVFEIKPGIWNRTFTCASCDGEYGRLVDSTGERILGVKRVPYDPELKSQPIVFEDRGAWSDFDHRCVNCMLRADGSPPVAETISKAYKVLDQLISCLELSNPKAAAELRKTINKVRRSQQGN